MKRTMTVLMLAALVAGAGHTQQRKPAAAAARWTQEPQTVFGLKLGEPITEEQLRECSPQPDQPASAISFCRTEPRMREPITPVCCFAQIFEFGRGALFVEDGIATGLLIIAKRSDYQAVRELLVERYGRPTRATVNEVTTKAGAKFSSEELTWTGKAMQIVLQERAAYVDESAVHFQHLASAARSEAKRKARAKEDASKM